MIITRNDVVAREDMEAGVTPFRKHGNYFLDNLPFGEEHPEDIVPKMASSFFNSRNGQRAARNSDDGDILGLRKTAQITSIVTLPLHDLPYGDDKANSWLCDSQRFSQNSEDGFNRKGYIRPLGSQDHLAAGTIQA
jgi:hypothetical protein